jgi:hypothetical protein
LTVTDPAHNVARRARAAQARLPLARDGSQADAGVAVRDLADYDRAFGVAS